MSFHPSYTFTDADLVLASKEGTKFQVHSAFIKCASGFFRSMLEIPRDISEGPTDPIQMDESQEIIKVFLDAFYPDRGILVSDITSFDFFRDITFIFVEKYKVPAGVTAIRNFFFDSRVLSKKDISPILLYGLAKHFSWKEEAATAAAATLDINFGSPWAVEHLRLLNGKDVVDLYELRRVRRERVLDALSITYTKECYDRKFSWHNRCFRNCKSNGEGFQNNALWVAFRSLVSQELEVNASGSGFEGRSFWAQPLAKEVSESTKCSACMKLIVSEEQILEVIRKTLKACSDGKYSSYKVYNRIIISL